MAFRRNEAMEEGFERAVRYLIPSDLPNNEQQKLKDYIDDLTVELGPVVDNYPSWHPLVCAHDDQFPVTYPSAECGYKGLDHTIYFANGFLSCPYHSGQPIIDSVDALRDNETYERYYHVADVTAKRIKKPLYHENTDPILVACEWHKPMPMDRTIPKGIAVGLMLEQEVPCWRRSEVGETWETMRPYLLGQPCGKRSSIFLDQEAGQTMKKVYEAITYSGMFGPLKV